MSTPRTSDRRDAGFTFVELMIVTLLIGALAAIAIPTFIGQRTKAEGASAIADLRNAATAEEAQLGDTGSYVSNVSALTNTGFRRTANLQLGIAVSSTGYCEVASQGGRYWWFDSAAGGIQAATTTALAPPSSATGVCSRAIPSQLS